MMMAKTKILYVCPFAHYAGHYSYFSDIETRLLLNSHFEVAFLSFEGAIGKTNSGSINSYVVINNKSLLSKILKIFRKRLLSKWIAMFIEYWMTISMAVKIKKREKFDIIHLRDGNPFIFIPFLFSYFTSGLRWSIWLVADPVNQFSVGGKSNKNIFSNILNWLVNNKGWIFIYKKAIKNNKFLFFTENENILQSFKGYLNGIFKDKVFCIPLAVNPTETEYINKKEAREKLGLPNDKKIILSFGTLHNGKDLSIVINSLNGLEDILLVHAGVISDWKKNNFDLDDKVKEKVIIKNEYISDEEKKLYFYSADAVMLSYVKDFKQTTSMLWEASIFCKGVIASDSGELGELVKKFGLGEVFQPQNEESLKGAIRKFFNNNDDLIIKENCKKFNLAYAPDGWLNKYIYIIGKND